MLLFRGTSRIRPPKSPSPPSSAAIVGAPRPNAATELRAPPSARTLSSMPGTNPTDDVALLLDQLKALPLIDSADLDVPFAAYEAFELVLSAILRAALVQVPEANRRGKNGDLFRQFVVERFPI